MASPISSFASPHCVLQASDTGADTALFFFSFRPMMALANEGGGEAVIAS